MTQSTHDPLNKRQKQAFSLPKLNKSLNNDVINFYLSNPQNHHSCNCKTSYLQRGDLDSIIQNNFGEVIRTIKNTIDKSEKRLRESEKREVIQNEWSDVAMILDRLLCYFFSISTLATCALIFLNSPHSLRSW